MSLPGVKRIVCSGVGIARLVWATEVTVILRAKFDSHRTGAQKLNSNTWVFLCSASFHFMHRINTSWTFIQAVNHCANCSMEKVRLLRKRQRVQIKCSWVTAGSHSSSVADGGGQRGSQKGEFCEAGKTRVLQRNFSRINEGPVNFSIRDSVRAAQLHIK